MQKVVKTSAVMPATTLETAQKSAETASSYQGGWYCTQHLVQSLPSVSAVYMM